jgi:hypothetical protein
MNELVGIINHPGVPWGAGGLVGGVIGWFAGQPDCTIRPGSDTPIGCIQAVLPLFDVPADQAVFAAVGTLVGVGVAVVVRQLNK